MVAKLSLSDFFFHFLSPQSVEVMRPCSLLPEPTYCRKRCLTDASTIGYLLLTCWTLVESTQLGITPVLAKLRLSSGLDLLMAALPHVRLVTQRMRHII